MNANQDEESRTRRERWWRSALLIVATIYVTLLLVALVIQILGGFAQILLIIFTAWLLAFVLSPLVAWIVDHGWLQRGAAIGAVYAATLIGSGFLLFYAASSIGASMGELAAEFPLTRARIEGTLSSWEKVVTLGLFEPDLVGLYRDVEATATRVVSSAIGEVPSVTLAVLGGLVLVIILSLYMLADSERILARLVRIVPSRYEDEAEILERTVAKAFGGFLRAQVILAAVQTLLTIAVVLLFGLPYGFLIVAISAVAMLIPFFGPPLALVPPIIATAIFHPGVADHCGAAPAGRADRPGQLPAAEAHARGSRHAPHPRPHRPPGRLAGRRPVGCALRDPDPGGPQRLLHLLHQSALIDETPAVDLDDVLEEVRQESPDATPEKVAAIAADRVKDEQADEMASELRDAASVRPAARAAKIRRSSPAAMEGARALHDCVELGRRERLVTCRRAE